MVKYIAKRIGLAIVTIWAVATITFFLINLVPVVRSFLKRHSVPRQQQRWKQTMDWISRSSSSI